MLLPITLYLAYSQFRLLSSVIYVTGTWVSEGTLQIHGDSPASLYSSLPGTVILMMRTVALWDFDRRVIIVMLVLATIMLVRALLRIADRAKVNVALFSQVPTLSVMYIYVRSLTTNCARPCHLHPIMRRS